MKIAKLFQRKSVNVLATRWFELGDHPAVNIDNIELTPSILTDFGYVPVEQGDWVVEINGKIKILKDWYFKENYEMVPVTHDYISKLKFVSDCD